MAKRSTVALCFSGSFCGGAEQMMIALHEFLQTQGYETPLLLNRSGEVFDRFSGDEYTVYQIHAENYASKWFPFPYLWNVVRMQRILRRIQPQLVIVEGKLLTQVAALAGKLAKVPIVSYLHFPPSTYEVNRMMFEKTNEVVLCCEGLRKYFQGTKTSCSVVRNYIDANQFSPSSESDRSELKRKIFDVSPETPTASLVGHLSQIKGQSTLLSAVANLKQQGIVISVVLAGADNHPDKLNEQRLRKQISELGLDEQVKLLGKVQPLQAVYQASDIFVLPSHREGLPLAVLEAMSCGLPVIATNVDGTPEALLDGETGFLIEPDDVEHLASNLKTLIEQPELGRKFGEAGRLRVKEKFTRENWQNEFLELVERFCV